MTPLTLAFIFIIIYTYDFYNVKIVKYVNYYFETSTMENNVL
jgi:hypothetical protein